jgi:RimJ/RimL family protein N-acetyltransferase
MRRAERRRRNTKEVLVMKFSNTAPSHSAGVLGQPQAWNHVALLPDGTRVLLRPIRPEDAKALAELHNDLSSESRRLREFSFGTAPDGREIERLTQPDGRNHGGIVAFAAGHLVGHACFDRRGVWSQAEIAFEVADSVRGRGLGTLLVEALARMARGEDIETFFARVLPQDVGSLKVFRDLGLHQQTEIEDRCVNVTLDLTPNEKFWAAERKRRTAAWDARLSRRSGGFATAAR